MPSSSMKRAFALAAALAMPIALAGQQRPAAPTGTGLILGQVVDADSGKGVGGVVVSLGSPPLAPSSVGELIEPSIANLAGAPRRVLTADDGRFLFRDLPKGRYGIAVSAAGYVPATYGQGRPSGPAQAIDLADAERLGGVQVRIWKTATLSGIVTDDLGQPAVGVNIRAMRRAISGGQPRFTTAPTAITDDRGMYRLDNLVPADYVVGITMRQDTIPISAAVAADGPSASSPDATDAARSLSFSGALVTGASGVRVGDLMLRSLGPGLARPSTTSSARVMTYQPTYYPSATTPSQATLISLKSGEERSGINLQLRLVPAVRVSGKVVGPAGAGAFLGVWLAPEGAGDYQSEGQGEAGNTVSDATGAFTFLSIPSGRYTLKIRMFPRPATREQVTMMNPDGVPTTVNMNVPRGGPPPPPPAEPSLWAAMPVTVGDSDVTDLTVTLKTGLKLSGRVEFAGTRTAPTADQIQRMSIGLQSAEGRTSSPIVAAGRATPDGFFQTGGYAGGRYIAAVTTLPPGWSLKSIVSNGRDISVEPIELADRDITDAIITFTDKTTTLTGSVTREGRADGDADVVIFPADSTAWKEIGVPARRGRVERVTKAGTFSTTGLPAGDYFVAAIAADAPGDRRDPKVLERLIPSAVRVTLLDGETKNVAVRR